MADTHGHYSNLTEVRAVHMGEVSTTAVSAAVLLQGALEAQTLIDAGLGKLYTVPFPLSTTENTPTIIRSISNILTACWANAHTAGLGTRGRGPSVDDCKRARGLIDKLAANKVKIPGYTPPALPSSNTEGEQPIFAKVDTMDMGQESDQRDRLADERD